MPTCKHYVATIDESCFFILTVSAIIYVYFLCNIGCLEFCQSVAIAGIYLLYCEYIHGDIKHVSYCSCTNYGSQITVNVIHYKDM